MNENTETNAATEVTEVASEFCTLAPKVKKNWSLLPRVEWFRIDVDKGVGSASTWHAGYLLVLKVRGAKEAYLAGTIAARYGMAVKSKYATAEEARAAGYQMKKEWGRVKATKATAKKTKTVTPEDVAAMSAEQKQALMAMLMAA